MGLFCSLFQRVNAKFLLFVMSQKARSTDRFAMTPQLGFNVQHSVSADDQTGAFSAGRAQFPKSFLFFFVLWFLIFFIFYDYTKLLCGSQGLRKKIIKNNLIKQDGYNMGPLYTSKATEWNLYKLDLKLNSWPNPCEGFLSVWLNCVWSSESCKWSRFQLNVTVGGCLRLQLRQRAL